MAEFWPHETAYSGAVNSAKSAGNRPVESKLREIGPVDATSVDLLHVYRNLSGAGDGEKHAGMTRSAAEILYYRDGRPYYRVYPDYVPIFSETGLDVPAGQLEAPFPSFAVRLPKGAEPAVGRLKLRSFLFFQLRSPDLDWVLDRVCRACNVAEFEPTGWVDGEQAVGVWMVVETPDLPNPVGLTLSVGLPDPDELIGERIVQAEMANRAEYTDRVLDAGVDQVLSTPDMATLGVVAARIGVSVCFLASGQDKVLEPDVLNKDFRAYLDAVNRKDDREVRRLHDKAAKERGDRGYTVGRADALLGRKAYDVDTAAKTDATGHELRYRHARRAHFHTYRCGVGRQETKVRFVRMLVIRPDLPPAPVETEKGFSTPVRRDKDTQVEATETVSEPAADGR